MLRKRKIKLLSAYLDNELNSGDREFVENMLSENAQWKESLTEISNLKDTIRNQSGVPENPNFNQLLNNKLQLTKRNSNNFLPVPRYLLPAASLLIITALSIFILFIFQKKQAIESFIVENSNAVKGIYESSFSKNDLIPATTSLTNNDVFQFAVNGSLPVSSEKDHVFQFGNNKQSGTFFDVNYKNVQEKSSDKMNKLDQWYNDLGVEDYQKLKIDSVLTTYRKNLETSVLISPEKFLAVDADLWNINKALVYDISRNLSERQRERFFTEAEVYKQYANLDRYNSSTSDYSLKPFRSRVSGKKDFIILSSDTVLMKNFSINYDSLEKKLFQVGENASYLQESCDSIIRAISYIQPVNEHVSHRASRPFAIKERALERARKSKIVNSSGDLDNESTICRIELPRINVNMPDAFNETAEKTLKVIRREILPTSEAVMRSFYKNGSRISRSFYRSSDSIKKILKNQQNLTGVELHKKMDNINNLFSTNKDLKRNLHKMINLKQIKTGLKILMDSVGTIFESLKDLDLNIQIPGIDLFKNKNKSRKVQVNNNGTPKESTGNTNQPSFQGGRKNYYNIRSKPSPKIIKQNHPVSPDSIH